MTGRYQQRFGNELNPQGPPSAKNIDQGLDLGETTMPQRLKKAGYATGMVGKWHLGHRHDLVPNSRGFDEFFGFLGGQHGYRPMADDLGPNAIRRNDKVVKEEEYLTTAFGREAAAFITKSRQQPWFLYLPFNSVHTPMHATEKKLEQFAEIDDAKRRTYAAMQSAMDDAIGEVLGKLREAFACGTAAVVTPIGTVRAPEGEFKIGNGGEKSFSGLPVRRITFGADGKPVTTAEITELQKTIDSYSTGSDEKALLEALRSGRIAEAYLDVFETEPLPASSPFWEAPNCYITPHTAGDSDNYHDRALEVTIDNMRKYLAGRPGDMVNQVAH